MSPTEAREQARSDLLALRGTRVVNRDTGTEISFRTSGAKHATVGSSRGAADYEFARHMPEIVEGAKLVDTQPDRQGRNNVRAVHTYTGNATLDSVPHALRIIVRETPDGHLFYDSHSSAGVGPGVVAGRGANRSLPRPPGPADEIGQTGAQGNPVARGLGRDRPETRPLADDLRTLAAGRQNSLVRRLAAQLADLVGEAEVLHGEDLGAEVRGAARLDDQGRASASVAHVGDHEALLHEAVHVATLTRYGELGPHAPEVAELERLRGRAAKAFARRGDDPSGQIEHALTSADEFLAGGLTSPRVQQFLQRHNAAGLWGRFVDGVRGLLGVEPRYGNLLDRVLQHGARLIDQMEPNYRKSSGSSSGGATLYSRGRDEDGAPGRSWGAVGDLLFDPEFRGGDGAAVTAAIKRVAGDPKRAVASAGDRLKRFREAALYSTDSALRSIGGRFDAPSLTKLADIFHAEAGVTDHATGRTFGEAVTAWAPGRPARAPRRRASSERRSRSR